MKFFPLVLMPLAATSTSLADVAAPAPGLASQSDMAYASAGALLAAQFDLKARNGCIGSLCYCNGILGNFCGNQSVNPHCTNGHSFKCKGFTGETCDYGVRPTCVQCGELNCP